MINIHLEESFFYRLYEKLKGWFEIATAKNNEYKYVIDDIELRYDKDNNPFSMIRYKVIGVRTLRYERASEINTSHIFSLFKPEHAQIIVSIATIEAILKKPPELIFEKYITYISKCSLKINCGNRIC